ncbi:MAG: AbrB family transcriptional regulator [Thermoprotei archaeon]|nr:MAG: AbrB family transcriptional regulator [Thermoprotei archaeon]
MEYVVTLDERGRIVLPVEVRRRLGVKGKRKILLRVREDDVIELTILNKLYDSVVKAFEDKFKDWKEESHEASKLLSEIVSHGDNCHCLPYSLF